MTDLEHRSPVLAAVKSAHAVLPVAAWEATVALIAGVLLAGLGFGVPGAFVGCASVGVALVAARRRDHNRGDYVQAWWRERFAPRFYDLIAPDRQYRPLRSLPKGYRPAIARRRGRAIDVSKPSSGALQRVLGRVPSPLCEQVPLWDIIEDSAGHAVLVTPSFGAVLGFDVSGLHTVYTDTAPILQTYRRLAFMAQQLPDHWQAQFILHAETEGDERLDEFFALRDGEASIVREQADLRSTHLRAQGLRRYRLRLYVSRAVAEGAPFQGRLHLEAAERAAQVAQELITAAGMTLRRLTPAEVWGDIDCCLRPDGMTPPPDSIIGEDRSPRSALITAPVTWTPDAVRLGQQVVKVLTLTDLHATGFTDIESLFLDGLGFDFMLVAYVRTPSRTRTRAELGLLSRIYYATATGARVPSGLSEQRFEEIREALAQDQAGTQRVLQWGLQVAVWGTTAKMAQARADALQQRLRSFSYELRQETGRHDQQLLSVMMPGGVTRFDRWMTLLSNNVVSLLPLFDGRHGDAVPACLFSTDRGELFAYDPAAQRRSNWNSFVVGASGSGKSVFINALLANCMGCAATKGRVLVVDFAGPEESSYRRLASLYGGRFVSIISDDVGLNPFVAREDAVTEDGQVDERVESFLTVLLDLLVENQERSRRAKVDRRILIEAVRELYLNSVLEPCFRSFLEVLDSLNAQGPDEARGSLITVLEATLQSPGGKLFRSRSRLQAAGPFVVFDLFGIEAFTPDFQEAIVLTVCDAARRLSFSPLGSDERVKYVVLDEVAQLVRQEGVGALIQELYATARKHRTAVWTVTQRYGDFVQSGLSGAIRSNSTTGVFLSHASDARAREQIARDLSFNERESVLFDGLQVKKGEYSEFLLRVVESSGIQTTKLRLSLSSFEYELFTSDAMDRRRQADLRRQYPGETDLQILRRAAERSEA